MKRVQIYLEEEQLEQLKYLAAKQKRPYSELIRDAVGKYVTKSDKKKDKKKKTWLDDMVDLAVDMGGDVSMHIDDILYS